MPRHARLDIRLSLGEHERLATVARKAGYKSVAQWAKAALIAIGNEPNPLPLLFTPIELNAIRQAAKRSNRPAITWAKSVLLWWCEAPECLPQSQETKPLENLQPTILNGYQEPLNSESRGSITGSISSILELLRLFSQES